MSSIIEAINNFGITVYNNEPYFGCDYQLRKINNINYKYKIHKEQFFPEDMKGMKVDYIRNILKNEELVNYLLNKIKEQYINLNIKTTITELDSGLVYMYLIEKYHEELQKSKVEEVKIVVNQNENELKLEETKPKKGRKPKVIDPELKVEESKPKKKNITQLMKRRVWAKHIGEEVGKAKCLCCNMSDITQLTFNCGHIIAEANGGETNVENLLPICQSCNSSMGTQNLFDYKKAHGL